MIYKKIIWKFFFFNEKGSKKKLDFKSRKGEMCWKKNHL